jgi:alkanesulfonate monooxygenase SsuD/methylene tetrahydromethanopterin reductase-like flavin-dependent oxidoreductase (luciferase family)
VQELYLEGKQRDAAAAVPDALVDDVALVGPRERIAERLGAWRASGATTLLVATRDPVALRTMAELVL